jgi:4'-phosphopantetheinyl transferase
MSAPPHFLEEGLVYLVRARIQDPGVPLGDLEGVLSQEERDRAARFRFEDDSLRSSVGWGLLRLFLGRLLGRDPVSLRFGQNEYGKPFLEEGPSFNLAHSGAWVLIGVASGGRLGVDVERPHRIRDLDALAGTVFAPDELAEFRALPPGERADAFYRGWARKEAFIKALGGGLSIPLKEFSVSLAPGFGDVLRRVESTVEGGVRWCVRSLPDLPGAEGAFAWDRTPEGIWWIDPALLPL